MRQRDKMTADNVEQLFEIVRAVQRGDDPVETVEAIKAEEAKIRAEKARIEAERRRIEEEEEAAARAEAKEEARIRRAERTESLKRFFQVKKNSAEEEWDDPENSEMDFDAADTAEDELFEESPKPAPKKFFKAKPATPAKPEAPVKKAEESDIPDFSMPKWTMPELKSDLSNFKRISGYPYADTLSKTTEPVKTVQQSKPAVAAAPVNVARPAEPVKPVKPEKTAASDLKSDDEWMDDDFFDDDDDFEKSFSDEEKATENPLKGIGRTFASIGQGIAGGTKGLAGKLKKKKTKTKKKAKDEDDLFDEGELEESGIKEEPKQTPKEISDDLPKEKDDFFDSDYKDDFMDEFEDEFKVKRSRLASSKIKLPNKKEKAPKISRKEQNVENRIREKDDLDKNQGEVPDEEENKTRRKASLPKLNNPFKALNIDREKGLLALAVLLGVIILVLLVKFAVFFISNSGKSKYVTADEGLKVTVEDAPTAWTNNYPVVLRFKVDEGNVVKVNVNGVDYQPDADAEITVQADVSELNAVVTTEYGDKNAKIEIPKLDAEPPVLNVKREEDKVVVAAVDGRSGVASIQYAALPNNDLTRIPLYQEYTEPIVHEEGMLYYFYAEDEAGNKSNPLITTAEKASKIELEKDSVLMFPEEERYVPLIVTPQDANVENLYYESVNPEIVSVTQDGLMKALQEGSTVIHITADGLSPLDCKVQVSYTQKITITALGDCTFGDDDSLNQATSFSAFYNANGKEYFFNNVRDILKNDDVTFANFEGTLTDSTKKADKTFNFKGSPEFAQILNDGSVEVVTLSNNHTNDYLEEGLEDTERNLSEAGVEYCIEDQVAYKEVNGIKIAFVGIFVTSMEKEPVLRQAMTDAKEAGAQIIVVALHGGSELATEPDPDVFELAHIAVDEGASLVVGHHPHTLQRIEKYKGRYIAYSIANFCFGGNYYPADLDSIIFRQTFTVSGGTVVEDDDVKIIPCSISSGQGYNNYQPTPAEGSEAERIMNKLNNLCTSTGLSFTASTGLESNE